MSCQTYDLKCIVPFVVHCVKLPEGFLTFFLSDNVCRLACRMHRLELMLLGAASWKGH